MELTLIPGSQDLARRETARAMELALFGSNDPKQWRRRRLINHMKMHPRTLRQRIAFYWRKLWLLNPY